MCFCLCLCLSVLLLYQTERSQTACDPSSRVQGPAISCRQNVATVSACEGRLGNEVVRMYLNTCHYCEKMFGFLGICDRSMLWCRRSLYCVDFTVYVCPHVFSCILHMLLECTCTCHHSCVKLMTFNSTLLFTATALLGFSRQISCQL